MVSATKRPSWGSILFNFGVPGDGGRHNLGPLASRLNTYTGGYYDLVSFDPRRTENTILSCRATQIDCCNGIEMYAGTDKTFTAFLEACFKAGDRCALAQPNTTASSFEKEFYDWMDYLTYCPIPVTGFLLDYSSARGRILGLLYSPKSYDTLAECINDAMTGNLTTFDETAPIATTSLECRMGILCGDKTTRASRLDDVLPTIEEQSQLSRLAGDMASDIFMRCARWQMERERSLGDYNVETGHPVLTIGNTHDPVMPSVSALTASQSGPCSVALEQNGFGRCSLAQASLCTVKVVQAYLWNGTMPEPGTIYEVDEPLFSDITWEDVILNGLF